MTSHVRNMTPEQQAAALAAIIKSGGRSSESPTIITETAPPLRGSSNPSPPPSPADPKPRMAKDMSEDERQLFLKEHKKKFR
jgi:hypothetical protein